MPLPSSASQVQIQTVNRSNDTFSDVMRRQFLQLGSRATNSLVLGFVVLSVPRAYQNQALLDLPPQVKEPRVYCFPLISTRTVVTSSQPEEKEHTIGVFLNKREYALVWGYEGIPPLGQPADWGTRGFQMALATFRTVWLGCLA